jgi:hypothetical protein
MNIKARVQNSKDQHHVTLQTNDNVHILEVEVTGEFGAEGEGAKNVSYKAKVTAQASEAEICGLMNHTDRVTEIQNTLRVGTPVTLSGTEIVTM